MIVEQFGLATIAGTGLLDHFTLSVLFVRSLSAAGFTRIEMFGVHHGARLSQRPAIIAEQIDASLSGHWPAELEEFVSSVTVNDFTVTGYDVDTSLDLVVVAS